MFKKIIKRLKSSYRLKELTNVGDLERKGIEFSNSVLASNSASKVIKIFTIGGLRHLFYEEGGSFFVKNIDNVGFYSKGRKIYIFNNFNYDITKKDLFKINISELDGKLILSYIRDYNKKNISILAESLDGVNFKEKYVSKEIKNQLFFAKDNNLDEKYSAYLGENFIYSAEAKNLNKWKVRREYVLSPRQNFFDNSELKIVGTINVNSGILLVYQSAFVKDEALFFQLGGALFNRDDPTELIWRSDNPIWEQNFPLKDIGEIRCVGITFDPKENYISVYCIINGELMMVEIKIPKFNKQDNRGKIKRHLRNPILAPKQNNEWESKASFNAAAIYADNKFHLIYRAIGEDDVSTFGYASSKDGLNFNKRFNDPIYVPRKRFEGIGEVNYRPCSKAIYESGGSCNGGCEDPRITKIGNSIYMTYVAYNGYDVPGVALSSIKYQDFVNNKWNWSEPRLISKPGQIQKNWMIFPEKINGKFAIIHSIAPNVMIDYFDDIDSNDVCIENSFRQTDSGENRWDNIVRGAGAPPIKTEYGWLLFYHAMDKRDPNRYKVGAMILDYEKPEKILYRSRLPILEPDEIYENEGMKAGVVYVCGAIIEKEILYIYYGGADKVVCVATANANDFLENLLADKGTVLKKFKL